MEKDKIKIGNIEVEYTRSGVFKLFELYYKKECNSDRVNDLEDSLSKIETIEDKIQYCKEILEQYYTYLDSSTFAVSGMTMVQGIFPNDTKIFFDKIIQIKIDSLEAKLPQSKKNNAEIIDNTNAEKKENNYLESTIDEYLEPFKDNMNEDDYNILSSAIKQHIETGSFPELKKEIQVIRNPNQKKLGWAINRIYSAKSMGVEKSLLIFAHQNISLFKNTEFEEENYLRCNLYKYFTTKTQ